MDSTPRELTLEQLVAVRKIQSLMAFWGIQVKELKGVKPASLPPAARSNSTKYRHPVTGQTWDGVGSQPDWLKAALLKEGYLVEELRVASPTAAVSC